ncbi:hypothetical protein JOC74_003798 [Bacillus capparidis]|uniref:Uncharacterized protein n=1 Tax=Bacillus capparidis TaxID=1840411 RepID=A0ABS4D0X9_9BACI|nr:hypothetical protein [Bacillus capparidis]
MHFSKQTFGKMVHYSYWGEKVPYFAKQGSVLRES